MFQKIKIIRRDNINWLVVNILYLYVEIRLNEEYKGESVVCNGYMF